MQTKKLQDILEQDAKIDHIDFLSVDVEGHELNVIRSLDLTKYKPSVIMLENYLYDVNYNTFMQDLGYFLIQTIEYNYIYGRILECEGNTGDN